MAIAIASGVSPERGLYTAIVGGFIVSLLGGSRFQIGGPAGAFIVLVAATVALHGVDGLILATMMSGVFLVAVGYLRLGTYIKFIPYPVTVGFTAGIAVIIFASQITELFGLTLAGKEPGALIAEADGACCTPPARSTPRRSPSPRSPSPPSSASSAGGRHGRACWSPSRWPRSPLALLGLPVETIGTRFGGIPRCLPAAVAARLRACALMQARAARRHRLHAARRHRIAALGRRRRRHDRPPPPLQLRTGGAGLRQYRLGAVRRHLRHRHHRPHRHQCARRRAWPGLGHAACAVPAGLHARRRAARQLHPARRPCRRAGGRRLEHGREDRLRRAHPLLLRRRAGAARHLRAGRLPRPHRGHRRRLRARLGAVHRPHVEGRSMSRRWRAWPSPTSPTPRTATARPTMPAAAAIPTPSSTASAAPSSSAPPRRSPPCSTASPTSAATSCSTARPCPSSIPPLPMSSRAPPARRAVPACASSSPAPAPQVRRMLFQHGVRPPLARYKATTRTALAQLRNGRRTDEKAD